MQMIIFAVIGLIVILIVIVSAIEAKKRRESMRGLAQRLGLVFNADKDYNLARYYKFLDKLCPGSDQYAFNTIRGRYQDHDIIIFDYHYEVGSGKHKQTYLFSFFILFLPRSFPELIITREGVLSKIAQAIGYDDIDFESHEFSRQFCVRSPDKKFAYDICHARMIDYLLQHQDLSLEIEQNALSLAFNTCLAPSQIEYNLKRLLTIRSLIPDYLLNKT